MSRRRILLTTLFAGFFAILAMLYSRLINPQIFRTPASFFKFGTTTASISTATTMAQVPQNNPVIVVGSGIAGLCASYEALRAGASVCMLDRAPKPGGNSIKASSGINGAGSRFQKAQGIAVDDSFKSDTVRSAGRRYKEWEETKKGGVDRGALVDRLTSHSAASVEWLVDEVGVELSVVALLGGHTVARTHRGAGKLPPGAAIVTGLLNKVKEDPNFELKSAAEVTKFEQAEDGTVQGVEFTQDGETHHLEGPVVFATGGFAGDANGQLAQYRPDLKGMPATAEARPGTHALLSSVGAALIDMDSVQIHPTGFVDPAAPGSFSKFLAAEMLRGEGGILLDPSGKRFIDELQTRDRLSEAIMALPPSSEKDIRQWNLTILLDPGAAEAASGHLGFYTWKGLMQKKKVKDLDQATIQSIDEYADIVANKRADPFGRKDFGHWKLVPGEANREEDVVVGRITPVVHFTMGGVAFNDRAQVLKEGEEPIKGLFAAGEVTGGLHGDNRLGGSSLLDCVVFGRIAGKEAAKLVA